MTPAKKGEPVAFVSWASDVPFDTVAAHELGWILGGKSIGDAAAGADNLNRQMPGGNLADQRLNSRQIDIIRESGQRPGIEVNQPPPP